MKKQTSVFAPMTRAEKLWGWFYFLFQLICLPVLLVNGNRLLPVPLSDSMVNFIFFTLNFAAVCGIFHKFLSLSLRAMWADFWRVLQAAVLGFVAYEISVTLLGKLTLFFFPDFINVNDASVEAMAGEHFLLISAAVTLLVPVAEECFFRGLIFRNLWRKSQTAAYLLSMLAFAAIHVASYAGTVSPKLLGLCFLQYLPAGIWLAWAYGKSCNIFAPILIHAVVNGMGIWQMR